MPPIAQGVIHKVGKAALHAERSCRKRPDGEHRLGVLKPRFQLNVHAHVLPVFHKALDERHHVHHGHVFTLAACDVDGGIHDLLKFAYILLQRGPLAFVELFHTQAHTGKRGAQIVRYCRKRTFALIQKLADARLHTVEGLRSLPHFAGTRFRQSRSSDIASEAVGGAGQPPQGLHAQIEGQQAEPDNAWPAFKGDQLPFLSSCGASLKFLFITYMGLNDEAIACLKYHPEVVLISQSNHPNRLGEQRALVHQMMKEGLKNPVVFFEHYAESELENLQIKAAADMGALIFDGLCDGILLFNQGETISGKVVDATAFGILQAGRVRTSKTEYISCPGCGRTLYDLESTIARIKAATGHLKGLKIGIMGCIVNGPGEMADADYGYVGAGRGKISLYKKKECIEKNIPEEEAVEKLIELIKSNGDYAERT